MPSAVQFEPVRVQDVALVVLGELSLSNAFRSWLLEASGLVLRLSVSAIGSDSSGDADGSAAMRSTATRRRSTRPRSTRR